MGISFRNLQLDPPGHPASAPLPAHDPDNPSSWWLISGSPMLFENIGFSKTLEPDSDGVRRKLLACAECDLGPLGWCVLGGTDHWIAVDRVGYQVDEEVVCFIFLMRSTCLSTDDAAPSDR